MHVTTLFVLSVVFGVALCQLTPSMLTFFNEKEAKINALEQAVRAAYATRHTIQCASSFSACKSNLKAAGVLSCEKGFGGVAGYVGCNASRALCMTESVVRTATNLTPSTAIKNEECWTQQLDKAFLSNKDDSTIRWQYFGTPHGFYRIYPGVAQKQCASYDPRIRPWYVAATSGPKDVVLVLDISGSMDSANRMQLMQDAAKQVIDTLTIHDYVNVVAFSTQANLLLGTHLLQATTANKEAFVDAIDKLAPGGSTNFEAAFRKAFAVFGASVEHTSGCNKGVLFLTDGVRSSGQDVPGLYDTIRTLNAPHNATVFAYSLGSGASQTVPHAIACQNNGVWAEVPDGGDLRGSMSSYYELYALLRAQSTPAPVWVELYTDATGAGEMTTVSKALYDTTQWPPRLIGVLGLDVLASDMRKLEADYANLLKALVFRSNVCPLLSVDDCDLEYVRLVDFNTASGTSSETNRLCGTGTNCSLGVADSIPIAGYPDWRNVAAKHTYEENAVCAGCLQGGAVAGIVLAACVVLAAVVVGIVMLVRKAPTWGQTTDTTTKKQEMETYA